nr:flagellar biosynthetic protein FliO [Thauera linaloolentis]
MILPLLSLGAADALAQAAAAPSGNAAPAELAGSLFQMLSGLAVVIALLLACLWLIRRLAAPRGSAAAIKVLGAAAVGPRERVVLVRLGEQVLVLGVAPGSVTKLHEMRPEDLPPATGGGAPPSPQRSFPAWLKQAMERRDAR